ncbi:MAG: PhnA domain-containing protein [Sedimenticola sp.]
MVKDAYGNVLNDGDSVTVIKHRNRGQRNRGQSKI